MGRRQELAEAKRLLAAARLVTLTGPGGVGKTRLALRLAEQVWRAFPDGVRLVSLGALEDGVLVPHAVADALGMRDEAGRPPLSVLVEHLRKRRLLLVLDNCEHLLVACASLVGAVLAATEGVRVLATSRHRLGLFEEQLLPVAPMPVPDPDTLLGASAADEFPALQLFADRAAAVAPGFVLTAQNQASVARLCRRLDGLPLAIELAAVRMRMLGVEQLDERLSDRYRLLTAGSPVAPLRHQTLRAAVDWSHELCTPRERLAWARLAVFPGSFDLGAAEAVCAGEGLAPAEVLDTVAGLVDKSVLVREDTAGTVRYRLLELLRQYGRERLSESGEAASTRRRHRDYFLRLAEENERKWFGPDQPAIVARLRAEHDNLRAALDFCLYDPGEAVQGQRLVGCLWFYWAACSAWVEVRHWWQRLARRDGGRAAGALARAQWVHSLIPLIHSRTTAVLLAGAPPRPSLPSREIPSLPSFSDVLASPQRTTDWPLSFDILTRVEIACTLTFRGWAEHAVPLCTDALSVCEAHGEQWVRSYVLRALATARWALGEHEGAAEVARRCLRLPYVTGESLATGRTLELLAVIAAAQGDAERAAVLQGAVHRIWHDIGHNPMSRQQQVGQVPVGERRARAILGDRGYERACRLGRELARPEAVAYALGDEPGLPHRAAPVPASRQPGAASDAGLTPREVEVAELIAKGMTNVQIAEALVISRRTADGHVARILAKLGFAKRSQVAVWISGQERQNRVPEGPASPPR